MCFCSIFSERKVNTGAVVVQVATILGRVPVNHTDVCYGVVDKTLSHEGQSGWECQYAAFIKNSSCLNNIKKRNRSSALRVSDVVKLAVVCVCVCGTYISIIKAFRAEKITSKGLFDFQKLRSVTLMNPNSDEKFVLRKPNNYN